MGRILTINAGSSSLKYSVYSSGDSPEELCNGLIEGIGSSHVQMTLKWQGDKTKTDIGEADHAKGVQAIIETIKPVLDGEPVTGVGHRVVHGGTIYEKPVKLDLQVVETLRQFEPFAPLHQPANLSGVLAAMEAFPDAVQIGCFDTAFHRGHPWVNDTFALPRKYYDAGIRRYGFHGLSYDYITTELARIDPGSYKDRIVVCHLGNGASMAAILNGRSVASTMGFSALDGLCMGTRSGQLDPGVLLYFMQQEGKTAEEISDILYKQSGLLGLSGISNDMRELEESDSPAAKQAIAYFVFRIRRELGAMAAVLGGLDTIVFCGGIGENAKNIRAQILDGMEWFGVELNPEANERGADIISKGRVKVRVIQTDEELVIARAVNSLMGA